MNIAIFVKNLTSGGAEKQSVLLARALADDYCVHYIIFNEAKIHKKYLDMLKEDTRIYVKAFNGGRLSRFRSLVQYLSDNNISAIFSYLTAANMYASIAGKLARVQVFTGLRNAQLPLVKKIADRFLTNHLARLTVTNCFSGKINFVSQGFYEQKILVIPNCFENIKPYTNKSLKDTVHIITVGRFVPQKDYETAIQAISELRKTCANIAFDIVGYGDLEPKIQNWVKLYQVDDITTIYINPDNIPELLDRSDIYLSTSLFEGTSNSIMEGMNADLPIVATQVGDNDQLVTEGFNGYLCTTREYMAIAEKLKILVMNSELRIRMGKNSKERLRSEYSVEIFREKYKALL